MAAIKAAAQRNTYKIFWDRYSDKPSNEAMLLNKNADELEELDRADILASLPDFTDKDVVDIGAGIGRFTTIFSQTARHVTSTDFIESFIQKNKERNAAAKNIKYVVSDAANLNLPASSVDLLFTNWLMMYMADSEVVEFVTGALKWLRPDGYLKLRESCSEPSTGRKKAATLHTADTNPTHYRYSSLYIQLLKNVHVQDSDGKWWKFDLKWSASVPTYIYKLSNWRQVHWLAQKVPADSNETHMSFDEIVSAFSNEWIEEQKSFDALLDGEASTWCSSVSLIV
jgi:phosphoethanolamine N-methyltransferase